MNDGSKLKKTGNRIRTNKRNWFIPKGSQPRLELLAKALVGLAPEGCEYMIASGCVRHLHWYVYQRMTDRVPGFVGVEEVCGWGGREGRLGRAMVACGYLVAGKDDYYCPTALSEMPEDVKKRWTTYAIGDLNLAQSRATSAHVASTDDVVRASGLIINAAMLAFEDMNENQLDLFNHRPVAEDLVKVEPSSDMRDLIGHWLISYRSKYGRDYPLDRRVETAFIKRIRGSCSSTAEAKQLFSFYLGKNDPYFLGHPIGRLASNTQTIKLLTELRGRHGKQSALSSQAVTSSSVVKLNTKATRAPSPTGDESIQQ